MSASSESTAKTEPFAAALALQEEHARAYTELAERIRSKSPEGASVLLTMRQRQAAQLRQLMCIYGFSARKDLAIARPPGARVTEGTQATT
jgi:hypothetical protein